MLSPQPRLKGIKILMNQRFTERFPFDIPSFAEKLHLLDRDGILSINPIELLQMDFVLFPLILYITLKKVRVNRSLRFIRERLDHHNDILLLLKQ